MLKVIVGALVVWLMFPTSTEAQRHTGPDGKLRVALSQQPFSPNGTSQGPRTMANGDIQQILADLGTRVRIVEAGLTPQQDTEYGGWKRLGMALGNFADLIARNEADGYFTVPIAAVNRMIAGAVRGVKAREATAQR